MGKSGKQRVSLLSYLEKKSSHEIPFQTMRCLLKLKKDLLERFFLYYYFLKFIFYLFIFGYIVSLLLRASFLQLQQVGATLCCGGQASHCGCFSCCGARAVGTRASVVVKRGLSSCGSWALECRLSSCGAQAQLLHSMWDLPGPGLEPMSPALAGGFLTTAPPGKPERFLFLFFYLFIFYLFLAVLVLRFCAKAFPSCGKWGPLFIAVRGPLTIVASLVGSTGSRRAGSVVVAHGLSCSAACGILPDQGSNPCPLHWQADSQPLRHQGSPEIFIFKGQI